MKQLSLFLAVLISLQGFAFAESNVLLKLKNPNQAGVVFNYEALCEEDGISPVGASINQMCEVVTKSHLCAKVPKEDLLQCSTLNRNVLTSYAVNNWDRLMGCAQGAFNSVKDTLSFFWEIMKWAWNNSTSSEARGKSAAAVSEATNAAKLYLHTEYQKAYAKASPPLQEVKAISSMNAAIGKLIWDKIVEFIQEQSEEFGCLNEEGKAKRVCKVAGDIFLPPTGALALVKYGSKGLKQLPNLAKYFRKVPVITFAKTAEQFPLLTLTLNNVGEKLPKLPPLITHPREIPFDASNRFRPTKDDVMVKRADELEPEMREAITGAYNALNNPEILKAYHQDLFKEAVEWMAKKGRPADLELLRLGRVSKHALNVVLVRRMKARGETGFTTIIKKKDGKFLSYGTQEIKVDDVLAPNDAFRTAVRTGPFVDRGFKDTDRAGHGVFSHMLQRDIVHSAVSKATNGNPKKFYDYLGTKKGINWWADLFDSGDMSSMTRPETLTEFMTHSLTPNYD